MKHNNLAIWRHPSFKAIAVILAIYLALFMVFLPLKVPNGGRTVYTTRTGECYHKKGCSSLKYSKYRTTISAAVSDGYRSCNNCDPPELITGDEKINFSFSLVPTLILGSLSFSIMVWSIAATLFSLFEIPIDQIKLIWYPILSSVFLLIFLCT